MKLACTPGPLHLSLTSSAHNRQAFLLLFSLGEKNQLSGECCMSCGSMCLLLRRTGRSPSTSMVHLGVLGYDKGCCG